LSETDLVEVDRFVRRVFMVAGPGPDTGDIEPCCLFVKESS